MIMDELLEFADATAVTANAGSTTLIGDVIDLGADGLDIGNGEPVYLCIQTDTGIITGGNAGTIQFQLASDAQAAIATDGSATIHFATDAFVTDGDDANALDAGTLIAFVALPQGTYERYLGILSVVATENVTAGKINAFLTKDPNGWKAYPDSL